MEKSYLTNPTEVFRHFADAYRRLKPTVPIINELDQRVSEVIEEICAGKAVMPRPTPAADQNPHSHRSVARGVLPRGLLYASRRPKLFTRADGRLLLPRQQTGYSARRQHRREQSQ